jgi:hypothetical protein
MHPVDSALIRIRERLSAMNVHDWKDTLHTILPTVQSIDPNGDWTGESVYADLANGDGLDYVASVVAEWCADAGV